MRISSKLMTGYLAMGLVTVLCAGAGFVAQGRLLDRTADITDVTVQQSDQGKQLAQLRQKIKDVERSKSLEQLTEIDVSLQGIADTWADEDGQQTVRFVREELVVLQQQKLSTLDNLAEQSEAVKATLKSLLEATRTLAEDINFDVLIGVATAADSTKEELDKTQGTTTTGMTSLSSEAVNGLQTLKAALVARGNALKLGASFVMPCLLGKRHDSTISVKTSTASPPQPNVNLIKLKIVMMRKPSPSGWIASTSYLSNCSQRDKHSSPVQNTMSMQPSRPSKRHWKKPMKMAQRSPKI